MQLLERESGLADLTSWLAAASAGAGCVALIGGEAGIGKTSLLQAFAARHPRGRMLWGACDALFTPQPLAPLHDIARQAGGALAAAVGAGAGREGLFAAALATLDEPGTVAVFEDLHWADEATLDLIKFLGRRIHRTRAMIAVSYRNDEVGPLHPLRQVIGDLPRASTRRLVLMPLSASAVESLAGSAGRPSRGLHEVTGGNPLFVTEVLAAGSDAVPATVRDAVLARTSRLSQAAREVAEFACVVPGRVDAWLIEAAGLGQAAPLDECIGIGMLRHTDGTLAYRHELVRRALEDSLPPMRLRTLHGRVLALLSAHDRVPAARLVHHANGAHDIPAVRRLAPLAAAQAAALGAHREAAAHLQTAVHHADGMSAESLARLHEALSYECYLTDQIERAIGARLEALQAWRSLGRPVNEGDTLRWLSRLSWFAGRRDDAERYGAEAIAVLEPLAPGAELAMAYSNRAQLDMLAQQSEAAQRWALRAIDLAERLCSPEILSHALNNLGSARVGCGDEAGTADLERSLQIALDHGFQEHVARAYTNLGSQAVARRAYSAAAHYLRLGLSYCQERDLDSWRLYMLAWSARAKFEQGDWTGASADAEEVLRHRDTAPVSRVPALVVLGALRIRRGDPDAGSLLDQAQALAGSIRELQRDGPLAAARAEAQWLAGDTGAIGASVAGVQALARQLGNPWINGELAAWRKRSGDSDGDPGDVAEPYAQELSGDWQAAARTWQALGCPYERALVLGWYGGESEQREALGIFAQLGAAPAAEALRQRMRATGMRAVPRGVRATTRENRLGLTQREAQILGLMQGGSSNGAIARRLFLSTRTVDRHVSAILAKLGAANRAEAIDIARRS